MPKSLCFLSLLIALTMSACDFPDHLNSEMVSINQHKPLSKEKSLDADIRMGIGNLEIASESSSDLYSVDMDYDKSTFEPQVRYDAAGSGDAGRLSVTLESSRKSGFRGAKDRNRIRMGFSETLPLRLNVNNGVGSARLSLSRLRVSRLELESGVGGAKISSYDPNLVECERIRIRNGVGGVDAVGMGNLNFRELDFEGGVGGADLDFTGLWKRDAEIRIQVGIGGVSVRMPRDLGVEVHAQKHILSGLRLDGFVKRDSVYYSENYERAKIRVTLHVSTGIGGFSLRWV